MPTGLTLFDKIWNRHVVTLGPGGRRLGYASAIRAFEATHADVPGAG